MTYAGIDYGRLANTNRNVKTGIHYGVISCNSVMPDAIGDMDADYGEPTCPKCGRAVIEAIPVDIDRAYRCGGCDDYVCTVCEHTLDSQDVFGDEPRDFTYDRDGYRLTMGTDGFGIFVLESPFYTFAAFCSPCAPGAGDLDSPIDGGAKTYCLGADWFDGEKAPYPVYRVDTDELVV